MFKHPGKKLMTLSGILLAIGILISAGLCALLILFPGIITLRDESGAVVFTLSRPQAISAGAVLFALGALCSWVVSLLVYGFGQMIHSGHENSYLLSRIAEHTKHPEPTHSPKAPPKQDGETGAPAGDGPLFHPTHHGE